ncbi:MAG TPA: Re/Si-specific NAD(P)(+) transhydrogenase subunit alpha, partial [Actinomycetota bacterium]
MSRRLDGTRGRGIDRSAPVTFTFDGHSVDGYTGDTVASALVAAGIDVVCPSPILARPRGVFSAGSEEPNAFVRVSGAIVDPITPATMVTIADGLVVEGVPGVGRLPGDTAGARVAEHRHVHVETLVVGAGVAGLAAIGTASSLGAVVRAFDARPEVGEQVESMGAEFLRIDVEETGPSATGYAKEMGEDFNRKAAELYAAQAADVDIIITTALIPGRPAPRLITEDMVASMKPGSVVVDMAASNGGNVAGTVADQKVVTDNGVTILGYTDLPGRLPTQASQLFGTNLVNLLKLVTAAKDGEFALDLDDPVQRGMTVVRDGEVLWPPPPVQVSAAPAAAAAPVLEPKPPKVPMSANRRLGYLGLAAAVFLLIASVSPEPFLGHFMVFMLSVVIGFYVIGNVHHALHTPLMSVTNAISGIILVGALLQVGHEGEPLISVLAFVAILVA